MDHVSQGVYRKSSPGRDLAWAGLASVLVIVIGLFALGARDPHQLLQAQASALPFARTPPPPSRVMCRGIITLACAHRASDATGVHVAWATAPAGYQLAWYLASHAHGHGYSEAVFSDPAFTTQIELGSRVRFVPLPTVGTITNGSEHATVSRQLSGATEIELRWTHNGTSYSMLGVGALDLKTLVDLWRTVRYA